MPTVILPKLRFLHVPKTGGTSVGHWLLKNVANPIHYTYAHCKLSGLMQDIPNPDNDFVFTVVRNPWDRLVSVYHFFNDWQNPDPRSQGRSVDPGWLSYLSACQALTFEEMIYQTEAGTGPHFAPWWFNVKTNQVDWIDGDIDLTLRFENLEADFVQIQDRVGCWAPLGRELSTKHGHYSEYYTAETRDIVAGWYERDIEAFGYTFE